MRCVVARNARERHGRSKWSEQHCAPPPTLEGLLTFALKHEGLDFLR